MSKTKNRLNSVAIFLFTCFALVAQSAFAASVLDFDLWMDRMDTRIVDVQRKLAAQDDEAAITEAKEIHDLYEKMEDYFAAAGSADDAVKYSKEGKEMASLIAKSVVAKDYEAGGNAAVTIAKACHDCHHVYRPFP